ncbi:MAG: ion transporter [Paracoccaceae bacterium]|nr:ion transporter [Paracoccaceae bacterium]
MSFRARLSDFLDKPSTQYVIIAVIVVNAIVLGMETSKSLMAAAGPLIIGIDRLCLAIFTVELIAKLYARGGAFFRSGWNIFDLLVVGISYVPDAGGLSVLRALRILRVLRLVSTMPRLRRVIEGFLSAVPGMASVFGLMALIFYIASVIASKLFGSSFPNFFGDLGRSAYSLFQIMTLESWSMGIVRPVMEVYPYAWAFFVPFILITTFAVVNLVVGLIVNSMQEAHAEEEVAATEAYREEIIQRLTAIEKKLNVRGD